MKHCNSSLERSAVLYAIAAGLMIGYLLVSAVLAKSAPHESSFAKGLYLTLHGRSLTI